MAVADSAMATDVALGTGVASAMVASDTDTDEAFMAVGSATAWAADCYSARLTTVAVGPTAMVVATDIRAAVIPMDTATNL